MSHVSNKSNNPDAAPRHGNGGASLCKPLRWPKTRWNVAEIVSKGVPVLLSADYWKEQIDLLPNPPVPVDARMGPFGLERAHCKGMALWWDGALDIALIHFPSLAGTGHTGKFDSEDDWPIYDEARRTGRDGVGLDGGCVFVTPSAFNFEAMGVNVHKDIHASAVYFAELKWATAPMIANFAQYGLQARVMGEALEVSRQAIHKQLAKMPETLQEMVRVYGTGYTTPACLDCGEPTRGPTSRYCEVHYDQARERGTLKSRQIINNRVTRRTAARGGRKTRAFNPVAIGSISEWLDDGES